MTSVKVTFQPEGTTTDARPGERLIDVASYAEIDINNLCGGQGVCGKCRVKLLGGRVRSSGRAIALLDKRELEQGYTLACQAELLAEDVIVWIPPESRKEGQQILVMDHVDEIVQYDEFPTPLEAGPDLPEIASLRPLSRKFHLQLPKPTLSDNLSDLDRISRELRRYFPHPPPQIHFACLQGLSRVVRQSNWEVTVTVHSSDQDCSQLRIVEQGDRSRFNYGVAVDVGTTTIVAQLINLCEGTVAGVEASHNRQARYGEDVVSRMIFACGHGGLIPLHDAVISTINSLVDELAEAAGISTEDITCYVAAGNTVMTHLLLNLEPCHIRVEPYIPAANRFPPIQTADIGLTGHPNALLHCIPCVSSYVGGDITAGVLACGMSESSQVSALIDVGTNGEIVIGNRDWLVCCSSSAGPAFEGGGIQCGMRAGGGAIEKVRIDGEEVFYETVLRKKPVGICGSGLIDTVAELFREHIIDQRGRFVRFNHPLVRITDDVPEFVLVHAKDTDTGRPVVITEDDIGNLMKSKGAVLAAVKVLLENMEMSFRDLDRIFVAGGFGAHLDIDRAVFIGLLPDIARERIHFVGNSSLAGARFATLSDVAFRKTREIAGRMTYLELSVHPDFMNEFVAALFLPHTQIELFPSVLNALK